MSCSAVMNVPPRYTFKHYSQNTQMQLARPNVSRCDRVQLARPNVSRCDRVQDRLTGLTHMTYKTKVHKGSSLFVET